MNFYYICIVGVAFVVGIISSFFIIPLLKKMKIGQQERDDGPKSHLKKQGTPTMGGLIMVASLFLLSIVVTIMQRYGWIEKLGIIMNFRKIAPLLFVSLGFGIIGFIDDYIKNKKGNTEGLKPLYKMAGLLVIATGFAIYLITVSQVGTATFIPFFKIFIELPIWIYIPFTIVIMLAATNAVNLTDGIDGLSSCISIIILTCLTAIGVIYDVQEVVVFGLVLVGIVAAFLLFNIHPAKVFMGDTGSLMLGGAVSVMAIHLRVPILLLVIAIVPVLETLSVILQVAYYKKTKKRIFKMAPIHHHFELSGWNEIKIVTVFSLITLLGAIAGIMAL